MLYALDHAGQKINASPKAHGVCPFCQEKVIAKCGEIKIWHWAHTAKTECDAWKEHETAWHLDWKAHFPARYTEVAIVRNGEKHIADVCLPGNFVIEFQHSPISVEQIRSRENFYQDMLWVFDVQEAFKDQRLFVYEKTEIPCKDSRYADFIQFVDIAYWKHSRTSLSLVKKEHLLNLYDDILFNVLWHDKKYTKIAGETIRQHVFIDALYNQHILGQMTFS